MLDDSLSPNQLLKVFAQTMQTLQKQQQVSLDACEGILRLSQTEGYFCFLFFIVCMSLCMLCLCVCCVCVCVCVFQTECVSSVCVSHTLFFPSLSWLWRHSKISIIRYNRLSPQTFWSVRPILCNCRDSFRLSRINFQFIPPSSRCVVMYLREFFHSCILFLDATLERIGRITPLVLHARDSNESALPIALTMTLSSFQVVFN